MSLSEFLNESTHKMKKISSALELVFMRLKGKGEDFSSPLMRVQQTEHEPPSKVLPWLYSQNLKWNIFVPVLGGVAVALVLVVLVKPFFLVRLANLHGEKFFPCLAGLLPNADLVFLPVHIDRATPLGGVGVCIFFAECGSAIGVVVWFVVHSVFDD